MIFGNHLASPGGAASNPSSFRAGGGGGMAPSRTAQGDQFTNGRSIPSFPPGVHHQTFPSAASGAVPQAAPQTAVASAAPPAPRAAEQQASLQYQKEIAKQLLDALDEDSLWHLAHVLQQRGLINSMAMQQQQQQQQVPQSQHLPQQQQQHHLPQPTQSGLQQPARDAPVASPAPAAGGSAGYQHKGPMSYAGGVMPSQPKPDNLGYPASNLRATTKEFTPAAPSPSTMKSSGDYVHPSKPEREDDSKVDDGQATSLILRNLPSDFDQPQCQEWVDKTYKGLYDFLLWFPAKKTSRLNNCSYAFVNFKTAHHARRFRDDFHLVRFNTPDSDPLAVKEQWPLSIAVAKVQGFAENFIRFHHLLEDRSHTLCSPYFDEATVEKLPQEIKDKAKAYSTAHPEPSGDGQPTTLIIRNLPASLDGPDAARGWIDGAGCGGHYDFFLYLPPKRRRPENAATGGPGQGMAYAFVNFKTPEYAKACIEKFNGTCVNEGDPVLNVVAARVQGMQECLNHFSGLGESGRLEPWVHPDAMISAMPPQQQQQQFPRVPEQQFPRVPEQPFPRVPVPSYAQVAPSAGPRQFQ